MDEEFFSNVINSQLHKAQENSNHGDPFVALQEAVSAMKLNGGQDAVSTALSQTEGLLLNNERDGDLANRLHVLTQLMNDVTLTPNHCQNDFSNSILAESGRQEINAYALEDGSSFLCETCGGVVKTSRKEAHYRYWCQ